MRTAASGYPLGRRAAECDRNDRDDSTPRRMKPRRSDNAQRRPHRQQVMTVANREMAGDTASSVPGNECGKDTSTGVGPEP
jgi:hypothetical protein